jgi:FAD:protein FMN transferase
MSKKILTHLGLIVMLFCFINSSWADDSLKERVISGKTMGTSYNVTIVVNNSKIPDGFQEKIDKRLETINQSMSTYQKNSEISRFNITKTREKFLISKDFQQVLSVAKTVYDLSGGAYDPTVNPLLKLWGFRSEKVDNRAPEEKEIQKILTHVGFNKVIVSEKGWIQKKVSCVELDLASIAKGFGVDSVSELLLTNGFKNFLVEIGGEIYAAGNRADGNPWRIGINTPVKGAPFNTVYKTISLSNRAIATSGDYRNFLLKEKKMVSHIIDPKTGYPVRNDVVSTSVIAPTCTVADGLATAIMVMGADKGLELIKRLEKVEGLIVTSQPDGSMINHYSPGVAP